jgi:hypothetical protein
MFPTDILGLVPVEFGGVLMCTVFFFFLDLHHLLNVHVQLANKMGFNKTKNKKIKRVKLSLFHAVEACTVVIFRGFHIF